MPSIQEVIDQKQRTAALDRRKEYAVLLGRNVIESMVKALGEEQAKAFLDAHAAFDKNLEHARGINLFELIPVHKIVAFENFGQYVSMLRALQGKLKNVQSPEAKPVLATLNRLLQLSVAKPTENAAAKVEAPTAQAAAIAASAKQPSSPSSSKIRKDPEPTETANHVKYPDNSFRGITLPAVPIAMRDRTHLPEAYPNFDQVKNVVVSRFNKSFFRPKLYADLNACAKKSLTALVLHRKYAEGIETDVREYLAEAQQYLMDHNFVGYGLDKKSLVSAAARLDAAGINYAIDTGAGTLTVASAQTEAYAFLGSNLELVLRTTILALAKDVLENYAIEGRQAATDVVIAASSDVIQEAATAWLEQLQNIFNKAIEDAK